MGPLAHGQASRVPCSAEATGIRGRHASPGTPDSFLPALLPFTTSIFDQALIRQVTLRTAPPH